MPGKRLLVIDDESGIREFLTLFFTREGYEVRAAPSGERGLDIFGSWFPEVVITDLQMPGISGMDVLKRVKEMAAKEGKDVAVLMMTAHSTIASAVNAMREGAFDYVTKPFTNEELKLNIEKALAMQHLEADNARLRAELGERYQLGQLVGDSPKMKQVYSLVKRVMGTRINCLIIGESGTGKELVARAIHYGSERAKGPFVAVNCGAIPENLFESELFGYRKSSFTGALKDKMGMFAAANGGTLFLDEVGEMPLGMQVKVLRALAERKIMVIGDTSETPVDVRVVAATNRKLDQEVKDGRFREDLYWRLNVVQVDLPPLRDRAEDIPVLVHHFLDRFCKEYGKPLRGIQTDALSLMKAYPFPGNVRELQNIMERAVALETGEVLTAASLPERVSGETLPTPMEPELVTLEEATNLEARLSAIERRYLEQALTKTNGNKTKAAALLGITFRSFRYRLARFGLDSDTP